MGIFDRFRNQNNSRRPTADIVDDLRKLETNPSRFDEQKASKLFDEWRVNFKKDRQLLDRMLGLPYRISHKWSDADLVDMADDIQTLKICTMIAVYELMRHGRSQSTADFFANMQYQSDAYKLFGYNECDFPYCFSIQKDIVAEAVIKECLANGQTEEMIVNRFAEGFDEFAELICRPVMKKLGVTDRRGLDCFCFLHPDIVKVSSDKFRDGYYADAVFSAFKEVNNRVKGIVRDKTGQESDGESLMTKAFSPQNPIIMVEENLDTQTNRDTQKGYMMLFSGAISAIRNPKAHENLKIGKTDAMRKLMFASMLMHKLDESH